MKAHQIALAALFSASVAFAQEATPTPAATPSPKKGAPTEERFKKFDTDQDGNLTVEEFSKGGKNPEKSAESFKKRDKDADGKLTLDEYLGK